MVSTGPVDNLSILNMTALQYVHFECKTFT